jgi:hypothetical protein
VAGEFLGGMTMLPPNPKVSQKLQSSLGLSQHFADDVSRGIEWAVQRAYQGRFQQATGEVFGLPGDMDQYGALVERLGLAMADALISELPKVFEGSN